MLPVEIIADEKNLCGEGPLWDYRTKTLIWDDMRSSLVFQFDPTTQRTEVVYRDLMVACIALNGEQSFVFGGATGLHIWEPGSLPSPIATEHNGEALAFNDLVAGPGGRVYAGTAYWGAESMDKPGKLYRFDPDGAVTVLDEGFELANGMGFSPDDQTFYCTDSTRRLIHAYDLNPASGALSNRREWVHVPSDEGLPDGLTVDAEGCVWSAQWYGSQIVRYAPDSSVIRRYPLPAKQVSSVMFGGAELDELYITTAAESWDSPYMPPGYDPHSGLIGGALYRGLPGVQGRPEHIANL
jgi:sugar lactone lactonase YvrE